MRTQQEHTTRTLTKKAGSLLALLVAAVTANVVLSYGCPAARMVKRNLLDPSRGLATGMAAQGTQINMLCDVPLTALRAKATDASEVTGVFERQRQNLVNVGFLVAVGTSYRPFQAGDPLYAELKDAGVRGVNLDPTCLLYTLYVFGIISGSIKLYMVMADCSFGLIRLMSGIIGSFNRLSSEDKLAGVSLVGSAIRGEKRQVDFHMHGLFEGMRRDPSLLMSFVLLVDMALLTSKPGYVGSVFVITCESLSWSNLEPLYAQLRTLLEQLGDLDHLSTAEANTLIHRIVSLWADTGNALVRNLPVTLLRCNQVPVGCEHMLKTLRVIKAIADTRVPLLPTSKLDLDVQRLTASAQSAVQRASDGVRWAEDRIERAKARAARRVYGVGGTEADADDEADDEEGAGASIGDPDGCRAQEAHWRTMLDLSRAQLAELVSQEAAAAAVNAAASKSAGRTSPSIAQRARDKRKRDDANEAVRELLRATAKKEEFDLVESFKPDAHTVLKLELQTRKNTRTYYKGVTWVRPGVYEVTPAVLAAAGAKKVKNNRFETQVGAAKALAIAIAFAKHGALSATPD